MLKAFLAHSSKQKGYVDIVAERLGKANIIYDKWTFEEGNRTIDEIVQGLSETEVFVLFISNEALESHWVKTEIEKAARLIETSNIKRLYPIIIDGKIAYDDKRIPEWIQDNYNLKYVSKPTRAAERIRQTLRTLSWELYPENKRLSQLFVGRTEQIRRYEERVFNFEKIAPLVMVSAGIPSVGRRKFTLHCLRKSSKIRETHTPPTVILGDAGSVEDLIVRVYDLGFSEKKREDLLALLNQELTAKVALAADLLSEIAAHESILFIVDNSSIVDRHGDIVDWFIELVNSLDRIGRLFICVISRSRVRYAQLKGNDRIFVIEVPELEKHERSTLWGALSELKELSISRDDSGTICELFNGFPEQVYYTVDVISTEGLPYLLDNLHLVPDYNSEKVAHIVQKYESDELAMQVLGFLSDCEFASLDLIDVVFAEDSHRLKDILESLSSGFVIEFIGATREYFRLNDAIRDYVQRIGIRLSKKYQVNLENHVKTTFEDYDTVDRDVSDYVVTLKEALKAGLEIPRGLLLPSHFLNAMRDLYNHERRYDVVIRLADRVLLQAKYLDARIISEVRYWLCSSLARRRDGRMLQEVQAIKGADHDFLLGFYYRLTGRYEDAIERLVKALDRNPNYFRAKRELVQVYLNLEEYEMAFDLAKENYELLKNNPYNVHSYLRCLIRNGNIPIEAKRSESERLLRSLDKNPHEKAREMYMTATAEHIAIMEDDEPQALNAATDAMNAFPQSMYPPLAKIGICRKFSNRNELERTIESVDKSFPTDSEIFSKLAYLKAKALVLAHKGDIKGSEKLIEERVKHKFTPSAYDELKAEIDLIRNAAI